MTKQEDSKQQQDKNYRMIAKEWSNSPGKECPICKEMLSFKEAVTLCQCYIFTHKHCFLKKYNGQISQQFEIGMSCSQCHFNLCIHFQKRSIFRKQLSKIQMTVLVLLLSLIGSNTALLLWEYERGNQDYTLLIVLLALLVVLLGGLIVGLCKIFFKMKYYASDVEQTDRNLKVSAFQGIETDRFPEKTLDDFIHHASIKTAKVSVQNI